MGALAIGLVVVGDDVTADTDDKARRVFAYYLNDVSSIPQARVDVTNGNFFFVVSFEDRPRSERRTLSSRRSGTVPCTTRQ